MDRCSFEVLFLSVDRQSWLLSYKLEFPTPCVGRCRFFVIVVGYFSWITSPFRWILLAKAYNDENLVAVYHSLLDKESISEQVILRDIHRTFPAHDFFKEPNGQGQEFLYKISKAYSLYDEEVGYCQGLSFLAAALLLHMDDEKAFCVLVRIMYDYQLRDLFKLGFDSLHLRFYQLQKLIEVTAAVCFVCLISLGLHSRFEQTFHGQWR